MRKNKPHKMRRIFCLLAAVALLTAGCKKTPEIKNIGSDEITLPGEGGSATVSFSTNCAWDANVLDNWAQISPLSGPANESARITVTAAENPSQTPRSTTLTVIAEGAILQLTIKQAASEPKIVEVTGITLEPSEATLTEGDQLQLTATVQPDNATDKTVTWSISYPSKASTEVVSVTQDGLVTANYPGMCYVEASCGGFSTSSLITVLPPTYPVTEIILNKTSLTLFVGQTETLTATVVPDYATDKTVTWSISDPSVVTFEDGTVTAVGSGNATITATSGDVSSTCEVKVESDVFAAVDMGFPSGTLWANMNLGATSLLASGNYYMWGCTDQPEVYKKSVYPTAALNQAKEAQGTEFDVVTTILGWGWYTPTKDQFQELIDNCNWDAGHFGETRYIKGTSKINGAYIYLPDTFYMDYRGLIDYSYVSHYHASYWSSTPDESNREKAHYLYFQLGKPNVDNYMYGPNDKWYGQVIRPVKCFVR